MTKYRYFRDKTDLFDVKKGGVYYKKLSGDCLMILRTISTSTYWKSEKHVGWESRNDVQAYDNVTIPEEIDGMKVVAVEVPPCAPSAAVISNVSFPKTIKTFGESLMCLTNVVLPSSVTDSHYNTIACCNNITIPSSVKTIGSFFRCNMVTIPSSVTLIQSIHGGVDYNGNPQSLNQVLKIDNPKPPILVNNEANEDSILFVPQGCMDAYKKAPQWEKFKRIQEDPTLSTSVASPSTMSSVDTFAKEGSLSSQESDELESLINAALADGVLTDKEKQILFKKAQSLGFDLDEFELRLDARLFQMQEAEEERTKKEQWTKEHEKIALLSSQILESKIEQIKQEAEQSLEELTKKRLYGYSLIEAKNSIDEKKRERIKDSIVSFPIPNSKDDLLDFMDYLKIKRDLNFECRKKYDQCVEKAIQLFPEDPIVKSIIDKRKKEAEDKKKEDAEYEKKRKSKKIGCLIFIIIIGLAIAAKKLFF